MQLVITVFEHAVTSQWLGEMNLVSRQMLPIKCLFKKTKLSLSNLTSITFCAM